MSVDIPSCVITADTDVEALVRALQSRVWSVPSLRLRPTDAHTCGPTDDVDVPRAQFTKPVSVSTETVCNNRVRSACECLPIVLTDCSCDGENETVPDVQQQQHSINDLSIARSNDCAAIDLAINELKLLSSGMNDYCCNVGNVVDHYDLRFMFEEKSTVDYSVLTTEDCRNELCLLFETVNCYTTELCDENNDDDDDDLTVALQEMFYSRFDDIDLSVMTSRGNKMRVRMPEFADGIQQERRPSFVASATNAAIAVEERLTSHGHVIKLSRITGSFCKLNDVLTICLRLANCFVCQVGILTRCTYLFSLPLIRQWKMRLKYFV